MRQLLYVSNTSRKIAVAELNGILHAARRNNALLGVSGMLLYIDGGFLQILEGEERALRDLYARICNDKRHWEQRLLLDQSATPAFTGWSMGFDRLASDMPENASLFGITSEAIAGRLSPRAGGALVTMLKTFYSVQTGANLKLAVA